MDMIVNEFCKLRRTYITIVAVAIPLVSVVFGAGNYAANSETLESGWTSYWSQATLFYGMLFMVAGISILASSTWRVEHRGGNWNTLLTSSRSAASLVTAKLAVLICGWAVTQSRARVSSSGVRCPASSQAPCCLLSQRGLRPSCTCAMST